MINDALARTVRGSALGMIAWPYHLGRPAMGHEFGHRIHLLNTIAAREATLAACVGPYALPRQVTTALLRQPDSETWGDIRDMLGLSLAPGEAARIDATPSLLSAAGHIVSIGYCMVRSRPIAALRDCDRHGYTEADYRFRDAVRALLGGRG